MKIMLDSPCLHHLMSLYRVSHSGYKNKSCAFLYLFPIPLCTRQPFLDLREHRFKTRLWHLCKVIRQGCGKLFVSSFRQVRMRAVEVKPNNPTGVIAFQQEYIS
jgi:hypothetical protein